MAQLIVRNVDEGIVRRLKAQAARNGRSMEAEHRAVLEAALHTPAGRGAFIKKAQAVRRRVGRLKGPSSLDILRAFRDGGEL